jgi:hypothetical protein
VSGNAFPGREVLDSQIQRVPRGNYEFHLLASEIAHSNVIRASRSVQSPVLGVISSGQSDIAVIPFPEAFLQLCEALLKSAGHHRCLPGNNFILGRKAVILLLPPKRSSACNQRRSLVPIYYFNHFAPTCLQRLIGSQIDSRFKDCIERAVELAARAINIAARNTTLASLNVLPGSL